MDVQDVVLPANERIPIKVPGRFFMLIATGAPLTVRFKKSLSTFREVARNVEAGYQSFPGDWADTTDFFDGLEFESTINQTITIGISDRAANYFRTVGIVQVEGANAGTTQADVTAAVATSVASVANANRRRVHVQNVSAAGNARVGPGTVTATRGNQLRPGASFTYETTAAINCIREATDVQIAVTEETRV